MKKDWNRLTKEQLIQIDQVIASLDYSKQGDVLQTKSNCVTILEEDPLLSDALKRNLQTDRIDFVKEMDWYRDGINPFGKYLFMNEGIRIRGNKFNKRLTSICKKLNIPHRTMHKIRKTYRTMLLDSGMDESFTAEQMGHADVETTRKFYYFSNQNDENKMRQVKRAFDVKKYI